MTDDHILENLLRQELKVLHKSMENINYSLGKVQRIDLEADLSADDFELFDSFSSRFLRLYEVLFNRVIRTTLALLRESQPTVVDNMNKAEKLNLITSATEFDEIRKLRNQVAHEYLREKWIEIYHNLLLYTVPLLKSCQMALQVIKERFPQIGLK